MINGYLSNHFSSSFCRHFQYTSISSNNILTACKDIKLAVINKKKGVFPSSFFALNNQFKKVFSVLFCFLFSLVCLSLCWKNSTAEIEEIISSVLPDCERNISTFFSVDWRWWWRFCIIFSRRKLSFDMFVKGPKRKEKWFDSWHIRPKFRIVRFRFINFFFILKSKKESRNVWKKAGSEIKLMMTKSEKFYWGKTGCRLSQKMKKWFFMLRGIRWKSERATNNEYISLSLLPSKS